MALILTSATPSRAATHSSEEGRRGENNTEEAVGREGWRAFSEEGRREGWDCSEEVGGEWGASSEVGRRGVCAFSWK